jgi:hypothetical protein
MGKCSVFSRLKRQKKGGHWTAKSTDGTKTAGQASRPGRLKAAPREVKRGIWQEAEKSPLMAQILRPLAFKRLNRDR